MAEQKTTGVPNMGYGQALELVKAGKKVARSGWRGCWMIQIPFQNLATLFLVRTGGAQTMFHPHPLDEAATDWGEVA
jgi:hypothetical protein